MGRWRALQTLQGRKTVPGLPHNSCHLHSSSQKGSEGQEEKTGRLRPQTQEGPTLASLSAPLTSLVSECGEGLRMGCTSLTC